jgi:signal transduction histidine kinase
MARADRNRKRKSSRRQGVRPGKQKAAGLGHLLEVAAHDLRNPVSGIMSASEYLLEDASASLGDEHLAVLRSIESSSRQMLAVIDDISEIAALESGSFHPDAHPKDIVRMIQGIVAQNRSAADRKELRIELLADGGVPPIEMDSDRVYRAVSRLVSMSISSAPEGAGLGIRVAMAKEHVVVTVWTDDKALLHSAGERRMRDAGVTLSTLLIELVVKAHGGTIEGGSESGNGQAFKLTLPLSRRARSSRP